MATPKGMKQVKLKQCVICAYILHSVTVYNVLIRLNVKKGKEGLCDWPVGGEPDSTMAVCEW